LIPAFSSSILDHIHETVFAAGRAAEVLLVDELRGILWVGLFNSPYAAFFIS
jgi:hypothetical protein